jgi:hypothetical protein
LEPRDINPLIRKRTVLLVDPSGPERELVAWATAWNEWSTPLLHKVEGINSDGLASANRVLREIRECRRQLSDPPDPELRSLWHCMLDEIWEAACSTLYGDLEPARQHVDAALGSVQEIKGILQSWLG